MTFNFNINSNFPNPLRIILETEPSAELAEINSKLDLLTKGQIDMAHTIDEIFAVAKAEKTAEDALVAVVSELRDTIKSKTNLSVADQATVDSIFDSVSANTAALIAAANVGTPDQTPADVAAVTSFEAAPPEPLVPPATT